LSKDPVGRHCTIGIVPPQHILAEADNADSDYLEPKMMNAMVTIMTMRMKMKAKKSMVIKVH
jgi:hypothetical protein